MSGELNLYWTRNEWGRLDSSFIHNMDEIYSVNITNLLHTGGTKFYRIIHVYPTRSTASNLNRSLVIFNWGKVTANGQYQTQQVNRGHAKHIINEKIEKKQGRGYDLKSLEDCVVVDEIGAAGLMNVKNIVNGEASHPRTDMLTFMGSLPYERSKDSTSPPIREKPVIDRGDDWGNWS